MRMCACWQAAEALHFALRLFLLNCSCRSSCPSHVVSRHVMSYIKDCIKHVAQSPLAGRWPSRLRSARSSGHPHIPKVTPAHAARRPANRLGLLFRHSQACIKVGAHLYQPHVAAVAGMHAYARPCARMTRKGGTFLRKRPLAEVPLRIACCTDAPRCIPHLRICLHSCTQLLLCLQASACPYCMSRCCLGDCASLT